MNILPSFTAHRSRLTKEKIHFLREDILPMYEISSYDDIKNHNHISIEIGSGYGDTITHLAINNPEKLFIACEVYIDAISSICNKIKEHNIQNIKIFTKDARFLLSQIPAHTIEYIYLLFPDPWPKKKHHKRRIFTVDFLKEVHRILRKYGGICIATDHDSYKEHISKVIYIQDFMEWNALTPEDFTKPPLWWKKTKFQIKAEVDDRTPIFFILHPKK